MVCYKKGKRERMECRKETFMSRVQRGEKEMLKSERQKNICRKYSARDKDGFVHCNDCPLVVDRKYQMCRSNSHYDRKLKQWVPDGEEIEDE